MPFQPAGPQSSFSKGEELIIANEIKKLLEKGVVIKEATHSTNEYISTVFTRPKKDGSHRLILNLKVLLRSNSQFFFVRPINTYVPEI